MSETRRFTQNMEKMTLPSVLSIRNHCCKDGMLCACDILAMIGVRLSDDDMAWLQEDGYESLVDQDAATGDVIITRTKA